MRHVRLAARHLSLAALLAVFLAVWAGAQDKSVTPPHDVVIKGGTVLTITHGDIQNGSVWIHDGKIAGVGTTVNAPADAVVVNATGKFVMPGIIDSHSHIALDNDVNEATSPVTPAM